MNLKEWTIIFWRELEYFDLKGQWSLTTSLGIIQFAICKLILSTVEYMPCAIFDTFVCLGWISLGIINFMHSKSPAANLAADCSWLCCVCIHNYILRQIGFKFFANKSSIFTCKKQILLNRLSLKFSVCILNINCVGKIIACFTLFSSHAHLW